MYVCVLQNEHGLSRRAFFDAFHIVAVSYIAEFFFPFCYCSHINQLKVKFGDHYAIMKRNPSKFLA